MRNFLVCILLLIFLTGIICGPEGSWSQQRVTDPMAMKFAWQAIYKANTILGTSFYVVPSQILRYKTYTQFADEQVTGIDHDINFIATESDCPQQTEGFGLIDVPNNCPPKEYGVKFECHALVYTQPWDKIEHVHDASCHVKDYQENKIEPRLAVAGGWGEKKGKDPKAMSLAWNAIEEVNGLIDSTYIVIPTKIQSYRTQVVSGLNHAIDFVVKETDCRLHQGFDMTFLKSSCRPKANAGTHKCSIVVWEQPWLHTQKVTSKTCEQMNEEDNSPVNCPGCLNRREQNDPEAMELAWKAVNKMNKKFNSKYFGVPVKIISFSHQQVAGDLFKVDVVSAESNCLKRNVVHEIIQKLQTPLI